MLQALALHTLGQNGAALTTLEKALNLAKPEGYVRIFIDEGKTMEELLRQLTFRGIHEAYINNLLTAYEPGGASVVYPINQPLIEPLSKRELQVLRLLGTELTGPEIAQELTVSLNTMRTHTKNIYSKLDFNNSQAAVYRAGELNLI